MFAIGQNELLEGLENIQKKLCVYLGTPCDCKYGIKYDFEKRNKFYSGEQTGCPEVRLAYDLIKKLSEDEYNDLLNR